MSSVVPPSSSRIAVLGHFADGSDRVDGQILRTRIVRDELCTRLGKDRILSADTGYLSRQPVRSLVSILTVLFKAKRLVILPGPRGLSRLLPLYLLWKRFSGGKIHYLVIGGWLPQHLQAHPREIPRVKQCDTLHVQTNRMVRELKALGIENLHLLPNFRRFPLERPTSGPIHTPLRLVFLSRVTESKGLDLAVDAVRSINQDLSPPKVALTIYGQIQKGEEIWFKQLQTRFTPEITYAGGLRPEEINEHLIQHDVMLFPTWYSGEGFPGVLVDAMIAGIPVIASDWRDNRELVHEGETGLLCNAKALEDLILKIRQLADDLTLLRHMKSVSAEEAAKYHTDQIWPQLLQELSL